jgi:hypothetical protein
MIVVSGAVRRSMSDQEEFSSHYREEEMPNSRSMISR